MVTANTKTRYIDPYFLSCDWGTSSFRLNLVEINTGKIAAKVSNSEGIKKTYERWCAEKEPQNRIGNYLSILENGISELKGKSRLKIDRYPIVISGMASSTIGLKELPYSSLPIALNDPKIYVETIEATGRFTHKLYLISGVRSADDIMRGEEIQLLGLYSKSGVENGLYLLVGTHSKHVCIKDNAVISFRTYMTGELFDLISTKSILADSISDNGKKGPGPAFEKGINSALNENICHSLFQIRARDILGESHNFENYDYLSGLLIGNELDTLRKNKPGYILLWGKPSLQKYYATALDILHLNYTQIQVNPEEDITSLGHRIILKRLTGISH